MSVRLSGCKHDEWPGDDDSEHRMIATESMMGATYDVVQWVAEKTGLQRQLKRMMIAAGTFGLFALTAVGGVAGVTLHTLHAFTPAPHATAIDRLMDAFGKIGQESASKRLSRQMVMVYQGVLGLLTARTLYILHREGARDVRATLMESDRDRNRYDTTTLYRDNINHIMPYYGEYGDEENTILTADGWSLGSIPRGIINIMLGIAVYITRVLGARADVGDVTNTVDNILKILCYEEIMCKLLRMHGYGALSQAAYATTWMIQGVEKKPRYASGLTKMLQT